MNGKASVYFHGSSPALPTTDWLQYRASEPSPLIGCGFEWRHPLDNVDMFKLIPVIFFLALLLSLNFHSPTHEKHVANVTSPTAFS